MPETWTLLRRDDVALIIHHPADGLPAVLHWGADVGALAEDDLLAVGHATDCQEPGEPLDAARRVPLLPQESDGWAGRPGLLTATSSRPLFPRWRTELISRDTYRLTLRAVDDSGLVLRLSLGIEDGGLVLLDQHLHNAGHETVEISWLEATLPVGDQADRMTSFTGRWTREKQPVTAALPPGSTTRESRRGRGGHDSPWVTLLSDGEPRNRSGEIWAVHLGWSADVVHRTDHLSEHPTLLGAGELLRPGEVRLAPGEDHTAPTAFFAHSTAGLDGLSTRFHRWLRSRPDHPRRPRPLVLNTWEAVYFDHDPGTIAELARRAARIGVERFVLDDGWFLGRRDDTAGLGDWTVDPEVWPEGLEPLAAQVHELGMEFGLWFEPEMVNLDSRLAREHPEWLLAHPASVPAPEGLSFRHQYVLDLARDDARAHVEQHISELVERLGIDFIKWDHNRDLIEPVHDGAPGTGAQTRAVHDLLADLRRRHPGLEIESCSSGGARTDLGMLAHTDRVWASDSNDPLERQEIQRWTELILPPELIGAHVGPSPAHSSGRDADLSFRAAVSLQGSAGFEWNILECSEEQLAELAAFGSLYRELRDLLHSGRVVHLDTEDPAIRTRGVVAEDSSEALFTVTTLSTLQQARPERIRFDGLVPRRHYTVRVREELGAARHGPQRPPWVAAGAMRLSGTVLQCIGLQLPPLWPQQALVLHLASS